METERNNKGIFLNNHHYIILSYFKNNDKTIADAMLTAANKKEVVEEVLSDLINTDLLRAVTTGHLQVTFMGNVAIAERRNNPKAKVFLPYDPKPECNGKK